jgi:hypothetical protein
MVNKNIPSRNISPYGWWIASYLMRYEQEREDISNPKRRCLAWENTIILKAQDRDEAYQKAMEFALAEEDDKTDRQGLGKWVCEGLTSLLPIYDKLEDGTEVIWTEHKNKTVKTIKSWIKKKEELECFLDE